MSGPDPLDAAAAIYVSIGAYVRKMRQSQARAGDLTLPEMSALRGLDRSGTATPGALAKVEQITPQAIGVTLATLEQRGLIQRASDPTDGRRVVMSLTEAGRQFVNEKRSARTELLAAALSSRFTPTELTILLAAAPLIERLAANI